MNIPVIAGVMLLLFTSHLVRRAALDLAKARASLVWPSVHGNILKSHAVQFRATSNHRALFVEYEYEVNEKKYTGNTASLYTLTGREAIDLEARHKDNPRVQVFYNPRRPEDSTLVVGPRKDKPYSDLIIGVIGVLSSIAVTVTGYLGYIG